MSETDNTARWYVVHTYSGYENKVKTNLDKIIENRGISHLIQEIKVPIERVKEAETSKERDEKKFPSYVFVKMVMTDETWHIVRNITGSAGFVGPEGKPVPLTAVEVKKLGIEGEAQVVTFTKFKIGDAVIVKNGPMEGLRGTISEISADLKTVTVLASFMSRPTPIAVAIESIVADES